MQCFLVFSKLDVCDLSTRVLLYESFVTGHNRSHQKALMANRTVHFIRKLLTFLALVSYSTLLCYDLFNDGYVVNFLVIKMKYCRLFMLRPYMFVFLRPASLDVFACYSVSCIHDTHLHDNDVSISVTCWILLLPSLLPSVLAPSTPEAQDHLREVMSHLCAVSNNCLHLCLSVSPTLYPFLTPQI